MSLAERSIIRKRNGRSYKIYEDRVRASPDIALCSSCLTAQMSAVGDSIDQQLKIIEASEQKVDGKRNLNPIGSNTRRNLIKQEIVLVPATKMFNKRKQIYEDQKCASCDKRAVLVFSTYSWTETASSVMEPVDAVKTFMSDNEKSFLEAEAKDITTGPALLVSDRSEPVPPAPSPKKKKVKK